MQRRPSLTPEEARELHDVALVIDTQQPPATRGFLFTESMRTALAEFHRRGMTRDEAAPQLIDMAAQEIRTSPAVRQTYLEFWRKAGVTVACGTYSGSSRPGDAFENASKQIGQAYSYIDALDGELNLVRRAGDIEGIYQAKKRGLILDFQNTTPFGDDLARVEHFYHLGIRMVQLTYNLRNLVGDGCTETYQGGLSYFGRETVRRLNEMKILVDVSHCSEQVGWDALEVSTAPVIISHSSSRAICPHARAKSDDLAKAVADRGGFFGVVIIPGFISETPTPSLETFARHVDHLVDVMGIDHVGIGTDKAGPGPGTSSMIPYPPDMPTRRPEEFNWGGFREQQHRLTNDYRMEGYENFSDWPRVTVALAEWGFGEEELRKLLGLNFLRVFRDVVG